MTPESGDLVSYDSTDYVLGEEFHVLPRGPLAYAAGCKYYDDPLTICEQKIPNFLSLVEQ